MARHGSPPQDRVVDLHVCRRHGDQVAHRSLGAEQYGRVLVDVFEEWVRHDVGDVFVQVFDTALVRDWYAGKNVTHEEKRS